MTLRFGTDGVRGVANVDLTPEIVLALGRAAARVLGASRWIVGRDTRISGPMIEAALAAGLAAEGATVELLGVAPTPEVAHLSAAGGVPGAMISASHNPFPDNGVKFFRPGGLKLSDAIEAQLEAELDRFMHGARTGTGVGTIGAAAGLDDRYEAAVMSSIGDRRLDGLHIVVDCANGAASTIAPKLLRDLGADVTAINDEPDGTNINDGCGSTYPAVVQRAVVDAGADAGLAFDGDADRVLAVDAAGDLVDGDQIIAVCAIDRHRHGTLAADTAVVTVMSNLGFRLAMADHGIKVVETQVGDRYVLQALEEGGFVLGGEQSGHVIFRDLATTGDGLLTAVQLLDVVTRTGTPLAELASVVTKVPQVLRNVAVATRVGELPTAVVDEVAAVEAELGEDGRVLVRTSGTEPLVRVMVEAIGEGRAEAVAGRLVDVVEASLGTSHP